MLLFTLEKYNLRNMVSIKSYSYSKLVLAYGPNHAAIVTVQWNDKANFKLVFGRSKSCYIDFNLETYFILSLLEMCNNFICIFRSNKYSDQCAFCNEGTARSPFK